MITPFCLGCGSLCGDCYTTCRGTCHSCFGYCDDVCTGCGNNCVGFCRNICTSCVGNCFGTCTGTCSSCQGTCTNTCTSCYGSCIGGCNNACTSTANMEAIYNLGGNIVRGNIIKAEDFSKLKAAIAGEHSRRKLSGSVDSTPVYVGNVIGPDYINEVINCIKTVSGANYAYQYKGYAVTGSSLDECIAAIKQLQLQTITV